MPVFLLYLMCKLYSPNCYKWEAMSVDVRVCVKNFGVSEEKKLSRCLKLMSEKCKIGATPYNVEVCVCACVPSLFDVLDTGC